MGDVVGLVREVVFVFWVFLQGIGTVWARDGPVSTRVCRYGVVLVEICVPFAHGADTGDTAAHVGAQTFVISRCKDTAAIVHISSQRQQLMVREARFELGIPGIGFIGTIVAEEPDLVISVQIGDGFRKVEFAPDGGIDVAVTVGGVKEDFGGCTTFECLDDVRDGEATVVTVLRAETEVAINDE